MQKTGLANGYEFGRSVETTKLIAFYLPQYHRIPENSEWWGPGFTEWTNVVQGRPNFVGHYQPHIPQELGFYDLTDVSVMNEQAEMAKLHGVYGFCFYHYWFSGKTILEKPVNQFLASDIDFPFCICWANENWTRTWTGDTRSVLLEQKYLPNDPVDFIESILPILKDDRYININGRPLLLVYRALHIPNVKKVFKTWRDIALNSGLKGLHIAIVEYPDISTPCAVGADAAVEFPPLKFNGPQASPDSKPDITNASFKGGFLDYRKVIAQSANRPMPPYKLYRGIMPSWDNTARRQDNSTIALNASPSLYQEWLRYLSVFARASGGQSENIIFVNAWNEWGEGCHLEPDLKWGKQYLEATSEIINTNDVRCSVAEAYDYLIYQLGVYQSTGLLQSTISESSGSIQAKFRSIRPINPVLNKISLYLSKWPAVHNFLKILYSRIRNS